MTYKDKSKIINKTAVRIYISIITSDVNGINAPTKRDKVHEWIQKQDLYICYPQETHFRSRETQRLKAGGWKKVFHTNGNQKKARISILISDKIDFKIKTVKRDKKGHDIMIKGSILEDITIIYAPNIGVPNYVRQILTDIKEDINNKTITVEDFNTPLISMDRSCRQKINKETQALNNALD